METQVADFDEPDTKWQVDRILSHSGSGNSSVFEIRWTLGDITWLPYGQVEHLSALTDYLQLLDIGGIQDLPRGTGALPSNNPQISCGACTVGFKKNSHSMQPWLSWRNDHPGRTPQLDYTHIFHDGEDFIFQVKEPFNTATLVPHAHLHLCLEYSVKIWMLVRANHLPPAPLGYNVVARVFNSEPSNPYRLSTLDNSGRWLLTDHPEPPPAAFFGSIAQETTGVAVDSRIGTISSWLIDGELWRSQKIKEGREQRGLARMGDASSLCPDNWYEEEERQPQSERNCKRRSRGQRESTYNEGRKQTRCRKSDENEGHALLTNHVDENGASMNRQRYALDLELDTHQARREAYERAADNDNEMGDYPAENGTEANPIDCSESAVLDGTFTWEQTADDEPIDLEN